MEDVLGHIVGAERDVDAADRFVAVEMAVGGGPGLADVVDEGGQTNDRLVLRGLDRPDRVVVRLIHDSGGAGAPY